MALRVLFFAAIACLSLAATSARAASMYNEVVYNPLVELDHCMWFGPDNAYRFDWQVRMTAAQHTLELRFTADVQRGFTSIGLAQDTSLQIMSGYPEDMLPCARRLYDNFSPYNVEGDIYPSYPSAPANTVYTNISHAVHYLMRNISTQAKSMLVSGGSLATNVTLLWAYAMQSMYSGACYRYDVSGLSEMAQMELVFTDPYYRNTNGVCQTYAGTYKRYLNAPLLKPTDGLLASERHQNTRAAILLIGGDMLVRAGLSVPTAGTVLAGENLKNVCVDSRTRLSVQWSGFTDPSGGVTQYSVRVGTAALPSVYVDMNVETLKAKTFTVNMPVNESIIISVTGYNFAGLFTTVTLNPMRVLNDGKPMFGQILHGSVSDGLLRYQRDTTTLVVRWVNYTKEDYSQKNYATGAYTDGGYDMAIGRKSTGVINDVVGWATSGTFATTRTVSGLALQHGETYTFSVRTTNCAGVKSLLTSSGVTIDTQPPQSGRVFFGNQTFRHIASMSRSGRLMATWYGFVDYLSGINHYEWGVGTTRHPVSATANTGLLVGWTNVGVALRATAGTLSSIPNQNTLVPQGSNIYVYVKAVDNAGNYQVYSSNATRVVN